MNNEITKHLETQVTVSKLKMAKLNHAALCKILGVPANAEMTVDGKAIDDASVLMISWEETETKKEKVKPRIKKDKVIARQPYDTDELKLTTETGSSHNPSHRL